MAPASVSTHYLEVASQPTTRARRRKTVPAGELCLYIKADRPN
ncbi:hypothetical protein FRUB_00196 [Fimbriiglobus ruber]|uniref:Uncharacterized protein n=1 Tax=Fimbriiglobus ruber TaxID=1908690 RepID=A0A225EDV2_9BACT|nr:hypothetical protein FRUB_00196 [Fimbriiglobus ruber]